MAARSVHGVDRVRSKLQACIHSGNYYEAHQMYRTLYFRYLSQEKYDALLELLCDGAKTLLKHNQHSSGVDLAILFVEVLVKSAAKPGETYFETLGDMFKMMSSEVPERDTYLAKALRWSITGSENYKSGHPQLHQFFAEGFWKEKNYVLARYHYLHSTDGQGYATMLVELHVLKGYQSEIDLFIAQAVLQYLCLQKKRTAVVAFRSYTSLHPNIKAGPPYLLPLLNFIWFLLKAVESRKLTLFTVICERYQPIINRDPTYTEYLDKIAQIFFGVPPPKPRKQGVLGNFFQSFGNIFNELNDSDSDEGTPSTSTTSTHKMETEDLD